MQLFLGSSSAAKSHAKALIAALQDESVQFLPWWEAFVPGRTLLEELDSIRDRVQGAVLVLSPEVDCTVRSRPIQAPNLNVLFEFGYFYGYFGKRRVAMVKYGDVYLPSDFGGYIHITGSSVFNRGAPANVAKRTTTEFARWVSSGVFSSHFVPPDRLAEELAKAQGELAVTRRHSEASQRDRAADAAAYRRSRGYAPRE